MKVRQLIMELNEKCKKLACAIFDDLGSGFDEPVYQKAFEVALRLEGIQYESQRIVPIYYEGYNIGEGKIDLTPRTESEKLIIELKAIASLSPKDTTQLKKYMELTGNIHGLLINFQQVGTAKNKEAPQCPEFVEI